LAATATERGNDEQILFKDSTRGCTGEGRGRSGRFSSEGEPAVFGQRAGESADRRRRLAGQDIAAALREAGEGAGRCRRVARQGRSAPLIPFDHELTTAGARASFGVNGWQEYACSCQRHRGRLHERTRYPSR